MKYLISICCIAWVVLFLQSDAFAATLFEEHFEDDISQWATTSGTVTVEKSTSPVFDGSYSVTLTYPSTSSQGLKRSIDVTANTNYRISGEVFPITATKAFIRVAWYEDGSTTQLKTDDSPILTIPGSWSPLEFFVTAPETAVRCEIRILVTSGSAAFDAIRFVDALLPSVSPTQTVTPTQAITVFPTPSATENQTDYTNIRISEVMTYPETGEKEWIELRNGNNFQVTLTNWYYDDIESGGSSIRPFSLTIEANSYGVIELATPIFNNDGDSVRLLNNSQIVKDTISYTDSQKGLSFGRINTDQQPCLQNPTKGFQNEACILDPTVTPSLTPTETIVPTISPTIVHTYTATPTVVHISKIKGTFIKKWHSKKTDTEIQAPHKDESSHHQIAEYDREENGREFQRRLSLIAGSYSSLSFISLCMKILLAGRT